LKKIMSIALSAGVLVGFTFTAGDVAEAKTTSAKTYKNCTELNKKYKGGVARSSSVKNKGGKTNYKPFVSKSVYEANSTKDRDKDGIACER